MKTLNRFYQEGDGGGGAVVVAKPPVVAGGGDAEKMIPKSRFDAVNNEMKALKARVAEYEPSAKELEKLRGERDSWKSERKTYEDRLGLARAGVVDDEHASDLAAAFGRLPEEGRPESAAAFWTALQEKPLEEWPRALRGYAPGQGVAAAAATGTDPTKKPAPSQKLPAGSASPTGANHAAAATATLAAANAAYKANPSPENRERVKVAQAALQQIQDAAKTPGR